MMPEIKVTLLEPLARRAAFLAECVTTLSLTNAQVVRGRAEEYAGRMMADVVTSRAVAPLDKLAGWSVGLARAGGRVLAIKGSSAETELTKARPVLARFGIADARIVRVGALGDGSAATVPAATVVTFTVPDHRASGTGSGGRSTARIGQRPRGHPSGHASFAADGRKSRPNSRRSGG